MSDISKMHNINLKEVIGKFNSTFKMRLFGKCICSSLEELCTGNNNYSWYIAYEKDNNGITDISNNEYYYDKEDLHICTTRDFLPNIEVIITFSNGKKEIREFCTDGSIKANDFVIFRESH